MPSRNGPTNLHHASRSKSARLGLPFLAAVTAGLGGCTVGPNYQTPRTTTPVSWRSATASATSAGATTMPAAAGGPRPQLIVSLETANLAEWWTALGDKRLDSLLSQALQNNLELKGAIERVNQARALRGVAKSQLFPTVDAVGGYRRSRISPNSPIGQQIPRHTSDDWQGGFDASWELDLFGRIRRGVEAANADLEALEDARRDVLVRLLAETARN